MSRSGSTLRAALLATGLAAGTAQAATITGRVIHAARPEVVANLEVVALGIDRAGKTVERRGRCDAEGRFELRDLPAPAAYLLSTLYDGIRFPGGVVKFEEGEEDAQRDETLQVYDHSPDAAGVRIKELRLVLDREADQFRAIQTVVVENPTARVVLRGEDEDPIVRVPLVAGHGSVQTPFGLRGAGTRVEENTLEMRGPIYPGLRELRLSYDLPDARIHLDSVLVLTGPIETLDVYVKDFGVEIDAGPLHPARPTRNGDEIYQRYFGFDLPAGLRLPLRVAALPPRRPPPSWAQALLFALLTGGSLLWVFRPVTETTAEAANESSAEERPERQALLAALADLEHDFETGKLSVKDRDRLRRDLKREALRALGQHGTAAREETPAKCKCGSRPRPGDRFCSACGCAL
ncbi:MAG: hypothetical protein ACE5FG_06770 [Myxococcota bacterium]